MKDSQIHLPCLITFKKIIWIVDPTACFLIVSIIREGDFSRPQAFATHVKEMHSGVRYSCTDPDRDNNNGEGWSNELSLSRHLESAHMGCKFKCSFNGCGNNKGRGFARSALIRHIKNAHHS